MPWWLMVYLILAIAAVVLLAIAYTQGENSTLRKLAIVCCIAAGIIFGIGWWGMGGSGWGFLGAPLFAALIPGFFGTMFGGLAAYIRKRSTKPGLSTGGKILCVFLLALGLVAVAGLVRGLILKNNTPLLYDGIIVILTLPLGIILLLKWIRK